MPSAQRLDETWLPQSAPDVSVERRSNVGLTSVQRRSNVCRRFMCIYARYCSCCSYCAYAENGRQADSSVDVRIVTFLSSTPEATISRQLFGPHVAVSRDSNATFGPRHRAIIPKARRSPAAAAAVDYIGSISVNGMQQLAVSRLQQTISTRSR